NGVALFYNSPNGNSHLIAERSDVAYEIHDWGEETIEEDLLVSVTSLYMTADGTVFALATDDTGQQLIYKGTPINGSRACAGWPRYHRARRHAIRSTGWESRSGAVGNVGEKTNQLH